MCLKVGQSKFCFNMSISSYFQKSDCNQFLCTMINSVPIVMIILLFFHQRLASLTSKLVFMTGKRMAQHLITSQPMVTTRQLAKVSVPINREIGGLGDMRTDIPNQ